MSTAVKKTGGRKTGRSKRKRNSFGKHAPLLSKLAVACSAVLLLCGIVGGSIAFLADHTTGVVNTFEPGDVTINIEEGFDGEVKSSVKVSNGTDSDTAVYIRVKLVSYRMDEEGNVVGGSAPIGSFTLADSWKKYEDFYYYTKPVEPGASTADMIGGSAEAGIKLEQYDDGSKQVIEVLAEAIQSTPASAVREAWSISVDADGSLSIPSGN